MQNGKKVLATTSTFSKQSSAALELLGAEGYEAIRNPFERKLTEDELIDLLEEHRPVGLLGGTEPITRAALETAKSYLRAVSRVGVGWDNVDHAAARELGIPVSRTQGILDQAVAELTVGMILAALRRIAHQDRRIRSGTWKKEMGGLLSSRVLGILGFGSIGQRVGELVNAIGARVLFHDPVPRDVSWAEARTLEDLLRQADILTIHASGSGQLLGSTELELLSKPGVMLVNTARGGMVDEEALYGMLSAGKITYACLDVFAREPYEGPLRNLDNVLLTPHIGSYAAEARVEMEVMAVRNLLQALGGS
ncbi:MAG: phosphoglycerate dehydrogenase [Candidatus Eisenbacteria sp.]|nr:phosphoglycerate dehydrogenase [Candidatus Eisenbacteria bacterium]